MRKGKFILNVLLIFVLFSGICAQQIQEPVHDILIRADDVYLDPLNHIYLINNEEKSITKYDLNLVLLKRISFNQGWDHAVMDVSDPFKIILYYPGDYKIFVLDESLAIIASYDESELNSHSAVGHFTTDYLAIFSNNILKLKNYEQQKIISSEPLFDLQTEQAQYPYQLKQSNEYLYLLRPGIGISRYNNQLFEEKSWNNTMTTKMDVVGDQLFYYSDGELIKFDTNVKKEDILVKKDAVLKSFSVNSTYIALLLESKLRLIRWDR